MITNKFKRNLIIIMTLLALLMSIFAPSIAVSADEEEEDANIKFNMEIDDYIGDSENFTDVIEKIQDDSNSDKKPSKNTISHIMKRMFNIGEYINDVEEAVLSKDLDVTKDDILYEERYACNPDAPNNLINHNCNIPNFTTGLIQHVVYPFTTPFINASKTSSTSLFGFGVPDKIPGDIVPANPANRTHTYTALELYGYDLKLTSYEGEWDKIDVSNQARMLSNFGFIDKFTLMGTGLWNSIKAGVGGLIENFSFNPFRWISSLSKVFRDMITGGINTVIDTSDLNIVATNGWKRESFSGTLYNVYVLTDKEVLIETNKKYFKEFIKSLEAKAETSPELLEVLILEEIPGFTFDPEWETDASISAREAAEAHNRRESARASEDYSPSYVTVPDPVFYTEKEQLGFWGEDNQDIVSRAANQGLISPNSSDYETYEVLVEEWKDAWNSYFEREFNALNIVVDDLLEESDLDVFLNNPHLDPKQPISHYACANPDGTIMKDDMGEIEYLYLKNNRGSTEFLNPNCAKARPPIGGGLFGSGWHINMPPDTRHIDSVSQEKGLTKMISPQYTNATMSVSRSFSSFIAKLTNTILGLSFSPILQELGIDKIISELVDGFKTTIFFPMSTLVAAIGAMLLFLQLIKNGSAWQLLISIFITFLIFIAGATFLMNPEVTLKLVDEVPSKLDNFLASAIIVEDDGTSYCSTGADMDGIRSAQCNVWGIMVFNPWVHLQFGTGYENLYAKGHSLAGGGEFQNNNSNLVGDAGVYMGGGHTIHNWALYQLDKTKAGTINDKPIEPMGIVDKDMYRIVDLQAGPNNGADSDKRYFETWSGSEIRSPLLTMLTIIQTLITFFAVASLGINKIEVSFMFAISIVFLPIMLLYALLPQGKLKLKDYLSTLVSLLIKRAAIVLMLSILLKMLSLAYSRSDSITNGALICITISVVFLMYKKEFLNILSGEKGNSEQVKQFISENIPLAAKHKYQLVKSKVKGATVGFIGGAAGAGAYKVDLLKEKNNIKNKISELEAKGQYASQYEITLKGELEEKLNNVNKELNRKENSMLTKGVDGTREMAQIIGRRTERSIRKEGHSVIQIHSQAKQEVIKQGADSISNKEEPTALDTYKEVLSHRETNKSKTSEKQLSKEDGRLLMNPKVQKEVRKLAKSRDKFAEVNKYNKDYTALSPDIEELEKVAKLIDKKRKAQKIKSTIARPIHEAEVRKEMKAKQKHRKITSNAEEIKKQILEQQLKDAEDLANKHNSKFKNDEDLFKFNYLNKIDKPIEKNEKDNGGEH